MIEAMLIVILSIAMTVTDAFKKWFPPTMVPVISLVIYTVLVGIMSWVYQFDVRQEIWKAILFAAPILGLTVASLARKSQNPALAAFKRNREHKDKEEPQ